MHDMSNYVMSNYIDGAICVYRYLIDTFWNVPTFPSLERTPLYS
jgi:hypothetical protein